MDDSKQYLDKIEFKEENVDTQKNLMGEVMPVVPNTDNELIKERVPTYNTLIDGIFNIA